LTWETKKSAVGSAEAVDQEICKRVRGGVIERLPIALASVNRPNEILSPFVQIRWIDAAECVDKNDLLPVHLDREILPEVLCYIVDLSVWIMKLLTQCG
jgi:hypothetical protein